MYVRPVVTPGNSFACSSRYATSRSFVSARTVTGVNGSLRRRSIPRTISRSGTSVSCDSRFNSPYRDFGRSDGQIWIVVACVLPTSRWPLRSRICPRGASTGTERNEFARAWLTYFVPDRTCSAHNRRKSAAKMMRRTALSSPTRVSRRELRHGATASGSGAGTTGGRSSVLAKQLHLGRVVAAVKRAEQSAHEPVDRRRQDQVHHDRRHEPAHERSGRRRLAE